MTTNERRAEIMRILVSRRHETMGQLASELLVTDRTIRSDITALAVDYPLETVRGNVLFCAKKEEERGKSKRDK